MKQLFAQLFISCIALSILAKDLGVDGHVFPIEEQDLLQMLKTRVKHSSLADLTPALFESAKHPLPAPGIVTAKKSREFTYDPTYILDHDIKNELGEVLFKKGTKFNPLEKIQLCEGLLFFDALNERQREWAASQKEYFKWILTSGDPFALEGKHKRPVYFDQQGTLARTLGLKAVPAKVTQKGCLLLIEEICLEKEKCVTVTQKSNS